MQKEAEKFVDSSVMEGMFSIRAILRAEQHATARHPDAVQAFFAADAD